MLTPTVACRNGLNPIDFTGPPALQGTVDSIPADSH